MIPTPAINIGETIASIPIDELVTASDAPNAVAAKTDPQ